MVQTIKDLMPQRQRPTQDASVDMKRMILPLPTPIHTWVKTIAEATGMTQPNVVTLALEQAVKTPVSQYIDTIKQAQAERELAALDAEEEALRAKRKRLTDLLS